MGEKVSVWSFWVIVDTTKKTSHQRAFKLTLVSTLCITPKWSYGLLKQEGSRVAILNKKWSWKDWHCFLLKVGFLRFEMCSKVMYRLHGKCIVGGRADAIPGNAWKPAPETDESGEIWLPTYAPCGVKRIRKKKKICKMRCEQRECDIIDTPYRVTGWLNW